MGTSLYFNNYMSSQEQNLIEDLVIESIKIYGHDLLYLPRNTIANNNLYTEIEMADYDKAISVEMYIKSVEGYEGEGEFLKKFNLEIRDTITLTIANRTFTSEVGRVAQLERPREGDLIYIPMDRRVYSIKFVDKRPVFYQLGALQMYDLRCELFEYDNEVFRTGVKDIDDIYVNYAITTDLFNLLSEDRLILTDEDKYPLIREAFDLEDVETTTDNEEIQTVADTLIDFTEADPFSEKNY